VIGIRYGRRILEKPVFGTIESKLSILIKLYLEMFRV
jgi:hypothetical protein